MDLPLDPQDWSEDSLEAFLRLAEQSGGRIERTREQLRVTSARLGMMPGRGGRLCVAEVAVAAERLRRENAERRVMEYGR